MKTIGFTVDDVLRDFTLKFIEKYEEEFPDEEGLTDLNPFNYFDKCKVSEEEIIQFLYNTYVLDIFGFADEVYKNVINDFNLVNSVLSEMGYRVVIISKEYHKARPSTLNFLSRKACECDSVIFVKKDKEYYKYCDILVTPNYKLFDIKPKNKTLIKLEKSYNKEISNEKINFTVKKLNEIINYLK